MNTLFFHLRSLLSPSAQLRRLPGGLQHIDTLGFISIAQLTRYFFLVVFNLFTAYFLFLSRRRVKVEPEGAAEIAVPFLATFWFLLYGCVELVPADINAFFVPIGWYQVMASVGVVLLLAGHVIAIAGVLSLRESFGVVVKVNEIKTTGMYGLVRHPIYFGYLVVTAGFILLGPQIINLAVYAAGVLIQIWRARIEERKLAAHSAEYRQYMAKIPFLFPSIKSLTGGIK